MIFIVVKQYPKRNVPIKNYLEEEEPAEDRYVCKKTSKSRFSMASSLLEDNLNYLLLIPDCDVCEKQYLDFCTKCGMLLTLESTPVPIGTENRAMLTVPKGILQVRQSMIHGYGVFALKDLNKGIRLGPYEGHITRIESTKGYSWKLKDGRLVSPFISG